MDLDSDSLNVLWRPPNQRKPVRWCKADGCQADLRLENEYTNKHKVCEQHRKDMTVMVDGQACRWCQRCTKFHDVAQFDGDKRSCRFRLQRLKARRRAVYTAGDSDDSEGSPLRRKPSRNAATFQPAPQPEHHHRLRSVARHTTHLHMPGVLQPPEVAGVLQPPPDEYDMEAHKQADMEWYASNDIGMDMGDRGYGTEDRDQSLIPSATDPATLGQDGGGRRGGLRARASVASVLAAHSPQTASRSTGKRAGSLPMAEPAPQWTVPAVKQTGTTMARSPAGSGLEVIAHISQPATPTSAADAMQQATALLQPTTAFALQPAMTMSAHAAPCAMPAVALNQPQMLMPVSAIAGDVQPGQAPVMLLWIGTAGVDGSAGTNSGPMCYAPYFLVPADSNAAVINTTIN